MSASNHPRNILVLGTNSLDINIRTSNSIEICTSFTNLKDYLYNNLKHIDDFQLHIPEQYLKELLENGLEQIEQVRRVHIHNGASQSGENIALKTNKYSDKFNFCRGSLVEALLENAQTDVAINPTGPIDLNAITNITTTKSERLSVKRRNSAGHNSSESKRCASDVRTIRKSFICPTCEIFFISEIYQLTCGHQLCKTCLNSQNK